MSTQGQRQEFLWRPNTNDSKNLTRYSQEAQHWTKAFRNAAMQKSASVSDTLGVIGLVIALFINLITLIVYGIGMFFKLLNESIQNDKNARRKAVDTVKTTSTEESTLPTDEEITNMLNNNPQVTINLYE